MHAFFFELFDPTSIFSQQVLRARQIVLDSVHKARDSDEKVLVRDIAESRAQASGNQGGGEESVLFETAAVGVTAPAEQMAPALGHDEAPMPHGASAARGDEQDADQSAPPPAGGSVSRELQEHDVPGDTEAKDAMGVSPFLCM